MRSIHISFSGTVAGVVLLAFLGGCSPEGRQSRHLERADKLYAEGKLDGAEIEYRNVLRVAPEDTYVIGQLGRIYQAQGRTLRAIEFLHKASQADPENAELKTKLGLSLLSIGRAADARRLAGEVLEGHPENDEAVLLYAQGSITPDQRSEAKSRLEQIAVAHDQQASLPLALGMLSLQERDTAAAKTLFEKAIDLAPDWSVAHSALGTLHWAEQATDQAEEHLRRAFELASPRSPQRLQYPRFKRQTGDTDTARALLEQITQDTPDYLPAWMALAEIALVEERYGDCESAIERVLTRESVHPDAIKLSAELHARTGEYERATADLEKLLQMFPRMAAAHHQLGRVAVARGDLTSAISSLEQAIEINPGLADAVILLARLYVDSGELARAATMLQAHIAENVQDTRAAILLAGIHVQQDEINAALEIYRDLERRFPDNPQFPYLAGMALLRQDKMQDAREAFEASLSRSPDAYGPLEQLTNLDLAAGEPDRARDRINPLLDAKPERPELHFLLGRVLAAAGDVTEAEQALRTAIEMQPGLRPATMLLAELYVESDREQEALNELRNAVDDNPEDVGAWMLIATIQEQQGAFPEAAEAYERILQIEPDSVPALNNLAYLFCEHLDDLDRAYELALRASDTRQNDPHLNDTLGWILLQRGELAWATSLLERSASRLPGSADVAYHLGVARYLAGAEDACRNALERALELDADFPGAEDARERLTILAIDPASADADQVARLEARVDDKPDDTIALLRLAAICERNQTPVAAQRRYESVLAAWPENVPALIGLARLQAWQLGDLPAGLASAEKAHALASDNPRVSGSLGRMVLESGDPRRATVLLRSALRNGDAPAVIHSSLAWAEFALGRLDEARQVMENAIAAPAPHAADNARMFIEMLQLASDAADPTTARTRAEAILRDDPGYSPAQWALAVSADRAGDRTTAASACEQLLERHPDFAPAKVRLAALYAGDPSRLAAARKLATEARNARPDDPAIVHLLGRIAYLEEDYARAITLLEQSRSRLPESADVLFHLGMSRWHHGDREESLPLLRQALELGLPDQARSEAEAVLASATEP